MNNKPTNISRPNVIIHESSFVDEPCHIGAGSKIWHFSHIMVHAEIGKNCTLGQNVFVASNVKLGDNVKIQNNVSLYTGVICEDDVFLGPSMVFTNVKMPRSAISRRTRYEPTLIKQGATIGANATILCETEIGRYAFVGAGAVVTHTVPDYALVVGVPALQVGWVCECSSRLCEEQPSQFRCHVCQRRYALRDSNLGLT